MNQTAVFSSPGAVAHDLAPFMDPLAIAIVLGGTLFVLIVRTPFADIGRMMAALAVLPRRRFRADGLLAQVEALSRIARRSGIMALDRSVIADPDVAAAIAAIVDRGSSARINELMSERLNARAERHQAAIAAWTAVAEIAPAMGMIGTLIGLVRMFTAMNDPAAIGTAMAVALLTTLYGAIIANGLALPIAGRLRILARAEAMERARLIPPLARLAEREEPRTGLRAVDDAGRVA